MPGGDRTGPMGAGPMTGRRAGYCAGYSVPGYANPYPYGGFGGRGRGYRRRYFRWGMGGYPGYDPYMQGYEPIVPVDEKEYLTKQAEALEKELKDIKNRLSSLEKEGK